MNPNVFYAAITAANLHYAGNLQAIQSAPSFERPARTAAEEARHRQEMATLGCSSVPPCPAISPKGGRCAFQDRSDGRAVPDGALVTFGNGRWAAQSGFSGALPNVGGLILCGLERFPKGAHILWRFSFRVDHTTDLGGLDWSSIAQIHQADVHYEDGTYVSASPLFTLNLVPGQGGDVVEVRLASEVGSLRKPDMDVVTRQQRIGPEGPKWLEHFPTQKVIARSLSLPRDRWHEVYVSVVDAHGGMGQVYVKIDNTVVVDEPSRPTGYGYVDTNVPFAGGPQDPGSYLKLGVYAGLSSREPMTGSASVRYKDVHIGH